MNKELSVCEVDGCDQPKHKSVITEYSCFGHEYMDLCEKDKNYNSVLCGLITIKKDSAKAKLQRDIYETAILLPQEIGLEEDLDLLTKAAREMYELQFPGERLPE